MFCPQCGNWNRAASPACQRCGETLPELENAPFERPDDEIMRLRRATGNRYRVLRRLGGGGMADVYVAEQSQLSRRVVIKVLHPHLARDAEVAERFRREAEAAAKLVHPHICGIHDYGATEDVVFTVMPYLEGGSFADLIQKNRCVDPARAVTIVSQVACALDYAHRHGVIHRDVKPDNVLFDEDGNAVLTDFGIATARFHARLTATGRAMGTPHYMSPEQAMGKLVDGRSDIYAVGILLYEALVGFPPFDGVDSFSVSYKQVHEEPVAPNVVSSRVPLELSTIVMKCLAKQPSARFSRGFELADALTASLRSLPETPSSPRNSLPGKRISLSQ
jgi:eukaryotic-like serine/threonine-protein kinase